MIAEMAWISIPSNSYSGPRFALPRLSGKTVRTARDFDPSIFIDVYLEPLDSIRIAGFDYGQFF